MFTGIVEGQAKVVAVKRKLNLYTLTLAQAKLFRKSRKGDSIAVDGVCLTVTGNSRGRVTFDLMKETLESTTFKNLRPGSRVNIEHCLKPTSPLGGHFVTGHIDGVGRLRAIVRKPNYVEFRISVKKDLMKYLVPKGSVALDGVSLTVGKVRKDDFDVYLIPYTLAVTNLGTTRAGDSINVETDILAKYILGAQKRRGQALQKLF
ncbi:MAG: riboflavin synthase [Candidatus Omnitrophota bacterium]|nr:riboflavin synthase [Candidatus Omnitrophota bacterium]MDZ4241342.1 riboflavin synthase [Candidatus Omnitrophota bacterium]